jgi:peptidoglycan/LPS O-acetylase OafA/YrhL
MTPQAMGISQSTSAYLNALRGLSATAVVFFHFRDKNFGPEWLTRVFPANGRGWVIVFFVLSGFVVSMLAEQKIAGEFAKDRAIRIYLVALPILLLSFLLSIFFPSMGPPEYAKALAAPLLTYGLSAVFLSQSWSLDLLPFLDGPYWSLSYEVMYYLIFGLVFYGKGLPRIVTTIVAILLAGPKVMALFPCWLAGVAAYRMRGHKQASRPVGWVIWAGAPILLILLFNVGLKDFANSFNYFEGTMSDGFVRSWFVAIAIAINIWAACQIDFHFPASFIVAAKGLAGMSFSLYLIHLPVLYILAAIAPDKSTLGFVCAALPTIFLASYGFAFLTEERRKPALRVIAGLFKRIADHRARNRIDDAAS